MTIRQLLAEIRKPGPCYVGTQVFDGDVCYVEAKKADLLAFLADANLDDETTAERRENGLFIG